MYYIPKISFPLSTTQFTMKQSKEIQSKFYRYALPKMGLNRHTPHAIIFGPAAMGCLELHDVYCDQLVQHLEKIKYHIRRKDNAGMAFLCNVHTYDILIGCTIGLMQMKPWNIPYIDQNTTVYYLWKQCIFWRLNITITTEKMFQQQYTNEPNTIMDDAISDGKYKHQPNELFAINCCRIFHGLIYPSEMSNYDGATINKNYLNGRYSKRNTKHQNWPNQPCPTDYQWQIWREFIYRRYLLNNKQQFQQRYSPSNAIRHQDITPIEKLEQIHKETPRNLEYKQYIFKLPYKYQQYLEYWKGGEDEIKKYGINYTGTQYKLLPTEVIYQKLSKEQDQRSSQY